MFESVSTVFVVDDDESVREGLAELMRTIQLNAETLKISPQTVQVHRTGIIEKLRIKSVPVLLTALHRFDMPQPRP